MKNQGNSNQQPKQSSHTAINLTSRDKAHKPRTRTSSQYTSSATRNGQRNNAKYSNANNIPTPTSVSYSNSNSNTVAFVIVGVTLFFILILIISITIGFHPPLPDSPVLRRLPSHHVHGIGGVSSDVAGVPNLPAALTSKIVPDDAIFVAMPSVNDPDCNASIISAFEQAADPDRIFFGVYQQTNLDSYPDCLDISGLDCPSHPLCLRLWHVRISRVSDKEAYGPTWGRYMADKLFEDETFYLVTDSHTFFRPQWDEILLNLFYGLKNEYAIITHYPKGEDLMEKSLNDWNNKPTTAASYHICGTFFESSENHMPRNANGCYIRINKNYQSRGIIVPFWAAGFSFSKSHYRNAAPWDPYTKWLFHGEEFYFGTRAWTHGYDFYSPPQDIVFHRYADKAKRGRMPYSKEVQKLRDSSEKRVNYVWGLLDIRTPKEEQKSKVDLTDIDKYGKLGNKRSLNKFWKWAGIDILKQNITVFDQNKWANGGLERIPWDNKDEDPVLHPK